MLYKDSGVDRERAKNAKDEIKKLVKRTFSKNVLYDFGLFGALYKVNKRNPVLVSSTDSIGTKIIIAKMMEKYEGLGEDIVNHCVNDILTLGAKPLFFLDYLAFNKVEERIVKEIIKGATKSCIENNLSLIGGETAEMPDIYPEGLFDVAGFIVGVIEKNIIDGKDIKPYDEVYGLPSSGLHTNGYTLARKVLFENAGFKPDKYIEEIKMTIGEALLIPHRSYLHIIYPQLKKIKGIAHITGGGFKENIVRILPKNVDCVIKPEWDIPYIFKIIQEYGDIPEKEMFRTFNMGIGMVVIGEKIKYGKLIGYIKKGKGRVILEGIDDKC
uniref:Phosphoribosylformylglycinamidine cyclo-ligase n=1 Tax=candidate division WOR-3 bacterium TaxID=2052148 RepID=A0A7C4YIQ0_UNCW3